MFERFFLSLMGHQGLSGFCLSEERLYPKWVIRTCLFRRVGFILQSLVDAAERFVQSSHLLFVSLVAATHVEVCHSLVYPSLRSLENEQDAGRIAAERSVDGELRHEQMVAVAVYYHECCRLVVDMQHVKFRCVERPQTAAGASRTGFIHSLEADADF